MYVCVVCDRCVRHRVSYEGGRMDGEEGCIVCGLSETDSSQYFKQTYCTTLMAITKRASDLTVRTGRRDVHTRD